MARKRRKLGPPRRPHPPSVTTLIRMPLDMKEWLEEEAARCCSSQNAEMVRAIRARMNQANEQGA
jgi:hypothetical protein